MHQYKQRYSNHHQRTIPEERNPSSTLSSSRSPAPTKDLDHPATTTMSNSRGNYSISCSGMSPPPPADLPSYSRTMHQHTKRQMEALSPSSRRRSGSSSDSSSRSSAQNGAVSSTYGGGGQHYRGQ